MFLSKAFSSSETDICQNLSDFKVELLQKKLKEWWTEEVDGDCISFKLYRNTETSIILLQRWRGDFRKEEYCQIYQQWFYLEELTQIDWSISKKQNNGRVYEIKIEDNEHLFNYCFGFETTTKSRFVRTSFNRLSKLKRHPVVYTTKDQKESNQIGKILIDISKFELSIEKTM